MKKLLLPLAPFFTSLVLLVTLLPLLRSQVAAQTGTDGLPAALERLDLARPVLLHPASQEFPDVHGDRVVWQDFRYGPTEIYLAELTSEKITNITQTPHDWEIFPDLDGDLLVWKDGYHGQLGLHGINLATGKAFTVTTSPAELSRPRLSGNWVPRQPASVPVFARWKASPARPILATASPSLTVSG